MSDLVGYANPMLVHDPLLKSSAHITFKHWASNNISIRQAGAYLLYLTSNPFLFNLTEESYITDGQDQVLRLEARLIGLSQGILICPLSFAREVAVAQSHNPQECCHSGNSCSQPSGQVEEGPKQIPSASESPPQPLNEISIEQTEAKASESCKDAVAECHGCQQLDVPLEQGFGIGFGDSKDGCRDIVGYGQL
ncbi:MAG: hypothetical protein FRX49_12906 [Trebouxia sp. A1-2]|nr:MAG: hypothetical protein FRX49_12906 [Trebouxia sp. A1-2]